MDRRDFLKSASTLLAATALPDMPLHAAEHQPSGRIKYQLNRNWLYSPRKIAGAEKIDFHDSIFKRVALPHANVLLPWHNFDDKTYQFVPPIAATLGCQVLFVGSVSLSTLKER